MNANEHQRTGWGVMAIAAGLAGVAVHTPADADVAPYPRTTVDVAAPAPAHADVSADPHRKASASAATHTVAPGWPDAPIVDELLRRETRAALAAQAKRSPGLGDPRWRMDGDTPADTPADPPPDRIDLAAIYGVGKRLDVEVLVNGRRLRYRHGRTWPDEAPDGKSAYALRGIQGLCVTLAGDEGHRRVCLSRAE